MGFLFMTGTVWPAFGASVAIGDGTVVVGAASRWVYGGSAPVFDANTRPTIWADVVQRPSAFQSVRAAIATAADAQDKTVRGSNARRQELDVALREDA